MSQFLKSLAAWAEYMEFIPKLDEAAEILTKRKKKLIIPTEIYESI